METNDPTKTISFLLQHKCYREAMKLKYCRSDPIFFVNPTEKEVKCHAKLCRTWPCPYCTDLYRSQLRARITKIIKDSPPQRIRFVTLTQIAHKRESLDHAFDRFEGYWQRLRRSVWWNSHVDGSIIKKEFNWNPDKRWWHVHAHLLVDTRFLPRKGLKPRWEKITGGAFIVDVQPIDDKTIGEMSSYITKLRYIPSVPLGEIVRFRRGRRFVIPYGSMRIPMKAQYPEQGRPGWTYFGGLRQIERKIANDDRDAKTLLIAQFVCDHMDDLFGRNDFIFRRCREYLSKIAAEQLIVAHKPRRWAKRIKTVLPKLSI